MSDALLNAGRGTQYAGLQEASRLPERLGVICPRRHIIIHCEGKVTFRHWQVRSYW